MREGRRGKEKEIERGGVEENKMEGEGERIIKRR